MPHDAKARRSPIIHALRTGLAALLVTLAPVYASDASAGEIVHVVAKGQTLGRIAKRYRVSVDALREANNLRPGERIHPGLSLVIPAGGPHGSGAVAKRTKVERGQERIKKGGLKAKVNEEKTDASLARAPKRRGFVHLTRGTERLDVQLVTRHGHLSPTALGSFSHLLRSSSTGASLAMDPRLAALIGQVSDHFGGRPLRVVSGFRPYSPVQYTAHSNHNVGRAMDFSVEGVPNTVLRDYCRTFRNAGVGYYPNSTFVHLDVRVGKAYWIDYAGPGEAPRYDSHSAQGSADEAAGDVEPHSGAEDAAPADPGSPDTH